MIDLANLEVWFVAGSQHLYGPEALKSVDEHSTAIASAHEWRAVDGSTLGGRPCATFDRLTHLRVRMAIHFYCVRDGWVYLVCFLLAALSRQSGRAS
jgi:hypothetical protein